MESDKHFFYPNARLTSILIASSLAAISLEFTCFNEVKHLMASEVITTKTKTKTTRLANKFFEALASNNVREMNSQLDPKVKKQLPASKLVLVWQQITQAYGKIDKRYNVRLETRGPFEIAYIPIKFKRGFMDVMVTYSKNGKVSGFHIVPHKKGYGRAPYVKPSSMVATPVKFGLDKWKLSGCLTTPKGDGPYPAVVLVHGSGPHDMDETIGSNKPFLDLAQGLASRGIAVLRYTKRTKAYKLTNTQRSKITVKEEALDDAIEAVKFLKGDKKIDPQKIFVIGHSLGGMLVPRLESLDRSIAGFVSMAGCSTPLADKMLTQYKYLASNGDPKAKAQLPEIEKKVTRIKNGTKPGSKIPDNETVLGASMAYWRDLNKHDPRQELKNMKKPVLFLQGQRDYQVTVAEDLANWKLAASKLPGDKKQFEFKVYPKLNHLFMAGNGKSVPSEYFNKTGHVDKQVVDDIAAWIKQH